MDIGTITGNISANVPKVPREEMIDQKGYKHYVGLNDGWSITTITH